MARRPRIEFEGAIYHVTTRGQTRRPIARDDQERARLVDDLAQAVTRSGWQLLAFVIMKNHLELFLKTPRPNISRGMQGFLSSYAHWSRLRRSREGQVFRGRYKTVMIEDASHYWSVSRYIHLGPVRSKLVSEPAEWPWSSYPGYALRKERRPWVAYDELLGAWNGEPASKDAASAYRRFVADGVAHPPPSPFDDVVGGWILGSPRYQAKIHTLADQAGKPRTRKTRQRGVLDVKVICSEVAAHYGLELRALAQRHGHEQARPMAAWLCRRYTESSLRVLAPVFGLARAECVPNLTRRFEAELAHSPKALADLKTVSRKIATASGLPPDHFTRELAEHAKH